MTGEEDKDRQFQVKIDFGDTLKRKEHRKLKSTYCLYLWGQVEVGFENVLGHSWSSCIRDLFAGVSISEGTVFVSTLEQDLCLSMAALETRGEKCCSSGTFAQVILTTADCRDHLLCTLVHGTLYQQMLDFKLSIGEPVSIKVEGQGTIHLSGYFENCQTLNSETEDEYNENSDEAVRKDFQEVEVDDTVDIDSSWTYAEADPAPQPISGSDVSHNHDVPTPQDKEPSIEKNNETSISEEQINTVVSAVNNGENRPTVVTTSWEEVKKKLRQARAQRSIRLRPKQDGTQDETTTKWANYKQKLQEEDPQKFEHLRKQRKLASQRYRAKLKAELQQENPSREALEKAERIRQQNRIRSQRARNKRLLRSFMSDFSESVKAAPSKLNSSSPDLSGSFTIVEITPVPEQSIGDHLSSTAAS